MKRTLSGEIVFLEEKDMITDEEASVRQFIGNGDVLCSFHCPFVKSVNSSSCFCLLFKKKLRYINTGNNELCYRCDECLNR